MEQEKQGEPANLGFSKNIRLNITGKQ